MAPKDSYTVIGLVKGEILDAPFSEGDTLEKDDLLFQIDTSNAENNVESAQLGVQQAELSLSNAQLSVRTLQKSISDLKQTSNSVSYTHLDVYKRQLLRSSKMSNIFCQLSQLQLLPKRGIVVPV